MVDGVLRGWGTAIGSADVPEEEYPDAGPLVVEGVRFLENGTGGDASGENGTGRFVKRTTITGSTFTTHARAAVDARWGADVTIDASTIRGARVGLNLSGQAVVTGSRFVRNTTAITATEATLRVERTSFTDNPEAVVTSFINDVQVQDSTFRGSGVAVDGTWARTGVRASTFRDNDRAVVLGWMGGTVEGNTVVGSRDVGISGRSEDGLGPVVVEGNRLRGNGDGIVLEADPGAVQLRGNDVRGSRGWGIHAPGAVDLGGNTASGNGREPQCVGVVCRRS